MADKDKRVAVFDYEAGDFLRDDQKAIVTVTEGEAVEQIALKALSTVRGVFLIYADVENPDLHHKYGNDTEHVQRRDISDEVKLSEFKRAIYEALIYDPWITDVYEINVSRDAVGVQQGLEIDAAYVSLKLSTIFDKDITLEGVNLNG